MCALYASTLLSKMLIVELKDQDGILVNLLSCSFNYYYFETYTCKREGDILYTSILFNRSVPVQDQLA